MLKYYRVFILHFFYGHNVLEHGDRICLLCLGNTGDRLFNDDGVYSQLSSTRDRCLSC